MNYVHMNVHTNYAVSSVRLIYYNMMLLSIFCFVTTFTVSFALEIPEQFNLTARKSPAPAAAGHASLLKNEHCSALLPRLPAFDESKYTADPTETYVPYNIHFVIPANISKEMREVIERAGDWINGYLSGIIKGPVLKDIRWPRQWNASLRKCNPATCGEITFPGEYAMPCPHSADNSTVAEPNVPENISDEVDTLNRQNFTLVVYVAAEGSSPFQAQYCSGQGSVALFSSACQWEPQVSRPTHGLLGICMAPGALTGEKGPRKLLHEVFHIMTSSNLVGLGSRNLKCPYTSNDSIYAALLRCENITYKAIQQEWLRSDGWYENKTRIFVITPRVKKAAQEHFGCESVEGGEVEAVTIPEEDRAALNWTVPADKLIPDGHWSVDAFPDEVVNPLIEGAMRVSGLTLGLLADLGYYQVNVSAAEPMESTRPTRNGCDIAHKSCYEIIGEARKKSAGKVVPHTTGPYCDSDYVNPERVITPYCSANGEPLQCRDLRIQFNYVDCPLLLRTSFYNSFSCHNASTYRDYHPSFGVKGGPGTVCVTIGPLYIGPTRMFLPSMGVCAEHRCDYDLQVVYLFLKPNDEEKCQILCPSNKSNELITANFTEKCEELLTTQVPVICPDYNLVCPTLDIIPTPTPVLASSPTSDSTPSSAPVSTLKPSDASTEKTSSASTQTESFASIQTPSQVPLSTTEMLPTGSSPLTAPASSSTAATPSPSVTSVSTSPPTRTTVSAPASTAAAESTTTTTSSSSLATTHALSTTPTTASVATPPPPIASSPQPVSPPTALPTPGKNTTEGAVIDPGRVTSGSRGTKWKCEHGNILVIVLAVLGGTWAW